MSTDPRWAELPPSLASVLSGALDEVADGMIAVLREEVPLYKRPLEGSFGAGIRLGVVEALRQFCLLVETSGRGDTGGLGVYEELGRGELRQGRPLEALLAAYRIGARFAWRRFATLAAEDGLGEDGLITLAELVFDHIDELSAASARGYAEQQSVLAGERDRARQALVRMLLQPAIDVESVQAAARLAGWRVPARVCAVVAPADAPLSVRLGDGALIRGGDPLVAVVGDPPADLLGSLAGTGAVVGPVRDLGGALVSRDRALALWALRQRLGERTGEPSGERTGEPPGERTGEPPGERTEEPPGERLGERLGERPGDGDAVSTDDHLLSLVLLADPVAAHDLSERMLAPLDDVADATRERLLETLEAWLRHAGERSTAADVLHVHPQTVRYRMGKVRELLGGVVDDPDRRLELLVALAVR